MNETLHIIWKDARHLRWGLVAWMIVVAADVGLSILRPTLDLRGMGMSMLASQLTSLTSAVQVVMMVLLVSWLVHEDPVSDREAFWLTRPIHPGRLTAAKLAVGGAALVLLPLFGAWITMVVFRVNTYDMLRATPSILFNQSLWMLALTAAATLTPSMTRYLLVLVGAGAAYVLIISVAVVSFLLFADVRQSPPRPEIGDPTPTIVSMALAAGLSLWVVAYQYRRRKVKRAATVGVAGFLAIVAVPVFWPSHRAADPDPGAWASDQSRVAAVVRQEPPNVSDEMDFTRRASSNKHIAVPVDLTGVPDDMFVQAIESHSRLDVAGTTLVSTHIGSSIVRGTRSGAQPGAQSALHGALGNVRVAERPGENEYEQWPVLLSVPDQAFEQYARTPGRLTSTIDFHVARAVVAGAMPLVQGNSLRDDTRRVDILGIERRVDGCTVKLRQISIVPLFRRHVFNNETLVLRNAARGEAVQGDLESMERGSSSPMSLLLALALGGGSYGVGNSDGSGFGVQSFSYRYRARGSSAPAIDEAWLAGADLVRVATIYSGHVTRSVTIADFVMAR
jgi:hypothetical protein